MQLLRSSLLVGVPLQDRNAVEQVILSMAHISTKCINGKFITIDPSKFTKLMRCNKVALEQYFQGKTQWKRPTGPSGLACSIVAVSVGIDGKATYINDPSMKEVILAEKAREMIQ